MIAAAFYFAFSFRIMLRLRIDFQFHVYIHRDDALSESSSCPSVSKVEPSSPVMADYYQHQIQETRKEGRFSTAANYQTALRSFLRFLDGKPLRLNELTPALVSQYERWLKSTHISMNTISCYLRSLRAVYNKAVEEKRVTDLQPFEEVYTGYPSTDKRSLRIEDIRKLQELPLASHNSLQLVRDLFLFCLFACGIPFVDMAFLRKSQIDDEGYLTYRRRKTNQQIHLKLPPCALEIVHRYRTDDTDYVFPILTRTQPEEAYRQYREQLRTYNRRLKELGRLAGITHKLTSYVSRHSWASLAYEQNADVSVISKGLGHTSSRTTQIYIKGIDDTRLEEANQKIVKEIMRRKTSTPNKR